jgi:hypothetical protein
MRRRAVLQGVGAGLVSTVVMTLNEKLEQRLTGRPDSHARPMRHAVNLLTLGPYREKCGLAKIRSSLEVR